MGSTFSKATYTLYDQPSNNVPFHSLPTEIMYSTAGVVNLQRYSDDVGTPKRLERKSGRRTGLRPASSDLTTSGLLYKSYVDNLISNSKYDRAKQFGLSPQQQQHELSFEGNQSYPKPVKKVAKLPHQSSDPGDPGDEFISAKGLDDFRGIEPNSVNFSNFQVPLIFSGLGNRSGANSIFALRDSSQIINSHPIMNG